MDNFIPRRQFLITTAGGLAGLALSSSSGQGAPVDTGSVQNGQVQFSGESKKTDPPTKSPPDRLPPDRRVGFAVVGLGRLGAGEILPAFGACKKARLVGLVSGTPDKVSSLASQYGVKSENIYNYQNYDKIKDNPEIQVIYIVLPNSMHAEYTIRAAQAGKHVLCEKPMCTSVDDAQKMIDACARAGRKLMIAYRCQYEPYNRAAMQAVRNKTLGTVGIVEASFLQNQANDHEWRLKKAMAGGGSLPDIGLYCLNGSRAMLNEEPYEVFARTWSPPNDPRFVEVESTVSFMLRFPSGAIANCASSYSLYKNPRLQLCGTEASIFLENAFAYYGQELTLDRVEQGTENVSRQIHKAENQFALEMDHMADCVLRNVTPHTPGEEGLQDHRLMAAIYESAQAGHPIKVSPPPGPTRGPDPVQT